jgi:transcriptional regulator of acetoin/glycerol metabolism
MERAVVIGSGPLVETADLPLHISRPPNGAGEGSLAEMEREHIQGVLDAQGWNITHAARVLGVDRATLYSKIRRYELQKRADGS